MPLTRDEDIAELLRSSVAALLVVTGFLVVLALFDPRSPIGNQALNVTVVALGLISLVVATARARAGSPQGWFFLLAGRTGARKIVTQKEFSQGFERHFGQQDICGTIANPKVLFPRHISR